MIRISVCGLEDDVDALGVAMERDLLQADLDLGGGVLIDVARTGTDKTVDGEGSAVSLMDFIALSVLD